MVTCAEELIVASAADTAVTLTRVEFLAAAGGVYAPDEETVPTAELPPAIPLTCQVTAAFAEFATYAANDCPAVPASSVAVAGQTATLTAGGAVVGTAGVALAGAVVVAEVGVITTSAVSCRPALSVTVNCTVPIPHAGDVTDAVA